MQGKLLSAIFTLSFTACAVAHADDLVLSFGAPGDPLTGSAIVTTVSLGSGEYGISDIEGTTSYFGGPALDITGLLGTGAFGGNDNDLFLTSSGFTFDDEGLAFVLNDGTNVNLYNDPNFGDAEEFQTVTGSVQSEYSTYTIAPTPEPGSFALLGTGILGAAAILRKRRTEHSGSEARQYRA